MMVKLRWRVGIIYLLLTQFIVDWRKIEWRVCNRLVWTMNIKIRLWGMIESIQCINYLMYCVIVEFFHSWKLFDSTLSLARVLLWIIQLPPISRSIWLQGPRSHRACCRPAQPWLALNNDFHNSQWQKWEPLLLRLLLQLLVMVLRHTLTHHVNYNQHHKLTRILCNSKNFRLIKVRCKVSGDSYDRSRWSNHLVLHWDSLLWFQFMNLLQLGKTAVKWSK